MCMDSSPLRKNLPFLQTSTWQHCTRMARRRVHMLLPATKRNAPPTRCALRSPSSGVYTTRPANLTIRHNISSTENEAYCVHRSVLGRFCEACLGFTQDHPSVTFVYVFRLLLTLDDSRRDDFFLLLHISLRRCTHVYLYHATHTPPFTASLSL